MKKEDWKNLAIFLFLVLITGPLIYYAAYRMFSYEMEVSPKAQSFGPIFQYRQGDILPAGNTLPCPVVPTSLCEGNFYVVPTKSTDAPIQL